MHLLLAKNEEMIKKDKRFSKANYCLRRNYLIEIAILKKRLIFDYSIIIYMKNMRNLIDFKSCYDRKLPNLGSIFEELAGRNKDTILLFAKIILV